MSDVPGVPAERTLGVQREGDGNWNIDGTRVLQQEGHLGAGSGLATGHNHALRRGGLIQAVFYRLILWHAEVQLVEAQQEGVPVLQGEIVIWFLLGEQWISIQVIKCYWKWNTIWLHSCFGLISQKRNERKNTWL